MRSILPDQLKEDARDELAEGTKLFLLLDDFRPKYLEYFKVLHDGLSQALVQPRELTQGSPLTSGALADFMPQFAAAINKAEPLNIPSIFEAAQNGAINKAVSTFSVALATSLDARLAEPARPTVLLGNLIEGDITLLLAQLASTISYMPQAIVQNAQTQARDLSATPKASALAVNLTRLRGVMATNINTSIASMRETIETSMFQDDTGRVTEAEAEAEMNSLKSFQVSWLQTLGNHYDPQSFPDGWRQSFDDAVTALKPAMWEKITTFWATWATNLKTGKIEGFTQSLVLLARDKGPGQANAYASEALTRIQNAKNDVNGKMDTHYRWIDRAAQKADFSTMVDNVAQTRRALWEQNDSAVREQLARLIQRLTLQYDIRLQEAIVPQVEPAVYNVIINDSDMKVGGISTSFIISPLLTRAHQTQLTTFLLNNQVSSSLSEETVLQFQGVISRKKSAFSSVYTLGEFAHRPERNILP